MLSFDPYRGRVDLQRLMHVASLSAAERTPLRSIWRPGDIAWQLKTDYERQPGLYFIRDGDEDVGILWLQGEDVGLELRPRADAALAQVTAFAEAELSAAARQEKPRSFAFAVMDGDVRRQAALADLGYARTGPAGVHLRHDLTEPVTTPVPEGFTLLDSTQVDADSRSQAHREPWSALGHMDIHGPSQFSTEVYRSLATAPAYDPTLDMLLRAPDGRLAAAATGWLDAANAVGHFEPVGTHPDFRGRRLAGALIAAAMRRMRDRGMRSAEIGTAHFNASAIKAYVAGGFTLEERSSNWGKKLG